MRSEMEDLVDVLKSNPGTVFIDDSGTKLFMLVGPEEKLMVAVSLKRNFHDMSEIEINEFIQNLLK